MKKVKWKEEKASKKQRRKIKKENGKGRKERKVMICKKERRKEGTDN